SSAVAGRRGRRGGGEPQPGAERSQTRAPNELGVIGVPSLVRTDAVTWALRLDNPKRRAEPRRAPNETGMIRGPSLVPGGAVVRAPRIGDAPWSAGAGERGARMVSGCTEKCQKPFIVQTMLMMEVGILPLSLRRFCPMARSARTKPRRRPPPHAIHKPDGV